jgi:hypothetical protein
MRTMAVVGLDSPTSDRASGADNPRTSSPGTKAMVLGSIIQRTMSNAPVTRNIGRQWVRTVQTSHRISLGRALRVNFGALSRSAGRTDCFHTTSFRRRDRTLITASISREGSAAYYSACTQQYASRRVAELRE